MYPKIHQALKARSQFHQVFSIPNVPLIEIDAVPAKQLAVFLLKAASAMVLLLRINVFQYGFELARAHRKRAISALPEKPAIASIKCFDPFRGCLLYLFDELSLGNSSRQRRDNVNMISNTANAHHFGTEITADCGKISMHPRPYVQTKPRLTIFRAKDDVNDDLA